MRPTPQCTRAPCQQVRRDLTLAWERILVLDEKLRLIAEGKLIVVPPYADIEHPAEGDTDEGDPNHHCPGM